MLQQSKTAVRYNFFFCKGVLDCKMLPKFITTKGNINHSKFTLKQFLLHKQNDENLVS